MKFRKYVIDELISCYLYLFGKKKITDSFNSSDYWENRYTENGNSGPGSYGDLADFKAKVLNDFVELNNIEKVIELGCGDGNQLSKSDYPSYIGLDISNKAINHCRKIFGRDNTKTFYNYSQSNQTVFKGDLLLSLDVIFHLVEEEVFVDYMNKLFDFSTRYVIIYSSNFDEHITSHVLCRKFTDWVEKEKKGQFKLINLDS